ncbi:DeoR/GlpR family DNA-binding transcription regulator [Agaribacterium sp. ZY112]|uniref:DeoR/GlpR family DNA-binding transcription regulator n=1 Tax=Agaribacterium sp. ZY112 TaxID=3233574 RepID=UPI0035259A16
MHKRNTKQRRHQIIEYVNELGEITVEQLVKHFHCSAVTIRKDLAVLEDAGLLLRRFGGAKALPHESTSAHLDNGSCEHKQAIAQVAASLIKPNSRIIIDSGATCSALLPYLDQVSGLVIMTNSLSTASQLRELENEATILMSGGTWDQRSESFQGQQAEHMLRQYNFDLLFIGADGLDPKRGTTTYNEFTGLSRCMADVSEKVIVLAEAEKSHRKIPNLELSWDQVDILITDAGLSPEQQQQITKQGSQVLIATEESLCVE